MTPPERLQDVIAEMREWAHGEGCFNDDPEGEPLLCVYYSQQAFLSLCDRIEAATTQAPQPVVDDSQPQQGAVDSVLHPVYSPENFRFSTTIGQQAVDVEVLRAFERKFWQAVSMTDSRDFDHDVCKEVRDFRDAIAALAATAT